VSTTITSRPGRTGPDLDKGLGLAGLLGFGAAILAAIIYAGWSVYADATVIRSGLQMSTIRNLAMAWIPTLPVSIMLSGVLYAVFSTIF